MKKIIILALLLLPAFVWSQLVEDFNDSTLLNGPVWQGNLDSFELTNNFLHLNAPSNTSESYIVTAFDGAVDGEWSFEVQLDFNPSSSNKALIYIMSDTPNLQAPLQGYFVMLGNSQDEVSLYRQDGISISKIIDGQDDILNTSSVQARVKLNRDLVGNFELFADTSALQNNWQSQGTVNDFTYSSSAYFGILCDYTSTRSDKFWFDNVYSNTTIYQDLSPPKLLGYTIQDLKTIQLIFDEALDSSNTYFQLNSSTLPNSASHNQTTCSLNFQYAIQTHSSNSLSIIVQDLSGNQLDTTLDFNIYPSAIYQEVLINEVYADETPSYGMPNAEFLELKNTSADTIHLINWTLSDAADTTSIPTHTLLPEEYLILCKTTFESAYGVFGNSLGVPNFPSLNNTGDVLSIYNEFGQLIDSLSYSTTFYQDERDSLGTLKKDGGYSLERLPFTSSCSPIYHWFPSLAPLGASPGQENSVVNVSFPPLALAITEVDIENDTTLLLHFNESLPLFNEQQGELFGNSIEQAFLFTPNSAYVLLSNALLRNENYTLSLYDMQDCRGTTIPPIAHKFFYFDEIERGDIVINEVLFNPHTGGVDFLEIFNRSEKQISLEQFKWIEYDVLFPNEKKEEYQIQAISVSPKSYHVFTEDTANIQLQYAVFEPAHLHENNIPNLPDDEGIIVLTFPNGEAMDSLYYRESWHLASLDIEDGVSLERISAAKSTLAKSNWHSAARTYGYATPTGQNSQAEIASQEGEFTISPAVFTPNEDGQKDYCLINYIAEKPGQIANVNIYDVQGRRVRMLAQNHSTGFANSWKWTGLTDQFERAPMGIYIVLLQVFDETGRKKTFKEKVVLGIKFN